MTLGFAARATHHRVARTSRTMTHKLVPYLLSAVEHPAVRLGFYTIRADQPEPDRSELLRGWGFLSDVQVPESEQHRIVGRLKRPRIKVDPLLLEQEGQVVGHLDRRTSKGKRIPASPMVPDREARRPATHGKARGCAQVAGSRPRISSGDGLCEGGPWESSGGLCAAGPASPFLTTLAGRASPGPPDRSTQMEPMREDDGKSSQTRRVSGEHLRPGSR